MQYQPVCGMHARVSNYTIERQNDAAGVFGYGLQQVRAYSFRTDSDRKLRVTYERRHLSAQDGLMFSEYASIKWLHGSLSQLAVRKEPELGRVRFALQI
jgi:hypothetical protein